MAEKASSTFSVFTPWARRFTDEHEREAKETRALYDEVKALHQKSPYADYPQAVIDLVCSVYRALPNSDAHAALETEFKEAIFEILELDPHICHLPEWKWPLSLEEGVDFRRFLRAKKHFLSRLEHREYVIDALTTMFSVVAESIPKTLAPSPFVIPLLYTLPRPAEIVQNIFATVGGEPYITVGLFVDFCRRYILNLAEIAGIADLEKPGNKILKGPIDLKLPLSDYDRILKGTPVRELLNTRVPLKFTHEDRFSHMHILGGSGAGKTTLLQNLILNDLHAKPAPSLVIVDSQTDLITKLSKLALIKDRRVILITPRDLHHPPAINVFDVKRLGDYDEAKREQITNGVVEIFDYLFTGLLGADLTAKQDVFFKMVTRLMLAIPKAMGRNATILDMLALMENAVPYQAAIDSLPPIQKQFFVRDFSQTSTYKQTREQVRFRLMAILENPTIANLFTSPETRIDLFKELNSGSVILIDTAQDFLKGNSAKFGCLMIGLVLQAALERAALPEAERHPAFLIVDEAAEYFDTNIDSLLTQVRKYKLGCVFAHQFLDQASKQLRASLAANTAIKFAGGVSVGDAREIAPDMRTTANFITDQPSYCFAGYIRKVTPSAVSIPVENGKLEAEPRLTEAEHEAFLALNRQLVSLPKAPQSSPTRSPRAEPKPSAHDGTPRSASHVQTTPEGPDPLAPAKEW